MSEAKILFIGPGAIGASVAAWVAESYHSVWIMGHGETQVALRQNGITTYDFAAPERTRRTVRVATVDRPGDIGDVDIVVLAVKNYNLEAVARQVHEALGDRPIIVSMANGIDNQRILPKFFSKVIYCVVGYNARRDAPVVVGYGQLARSRRATDRYQRSMLCASSVTAGRPPPRNSQSLALTGSSSTTRVVLGLVIHPSTSAG